MMPDLLSKRTGAELSMLAVAFIWGATFVVVKNGLNDIEPFLFLGLRFIIAFLVLAAAAGRKILHAPRSTWLAGSLLGIFLFIGYTFQTIGLQYTTSSNAGFVTGVSVVLVPILDALFKRTFPSLSTLATVILAAVGLYLMSVPAGGFHPSYGDLLVLVCAFGFAFHIVFVARYSHQHDPVVITSVQILFVGIVCMVLGLTTETWPEKFTHNAITAILTTSVLATSLAFLLQNALQKYSTPTRFAVVLTMEPVFAALAGYLWANEILSSRALVGAVLILCSMLMAVFIQSEPAAATSQKHSL
ncbi:MAG TPA: DMT family transporter [Syntrophomonadaceae bacterium]|nr:DMT family transporter [Syntrophomonadaceae bacterium]HOQ08930.1 DMT family transporter [Syntrophomonadaceae bacterium]HPU47741.1 DMT family transporter [Syntrophomonadaceae bacterium]